MNIIKYKEKHIIKTRDEIKSIGLKYSYNFNKEELHVKKGDVIGQVIFMKFLTCDDDCANGIRTGGFGSTDK